MATYMNNIFNFGRDLPAPFDTLTSKKGQRIIQIR